MDQAPPKELAPQRKFEDYEFQLTVSDNSLTASETAMLIMTDLKRGAVKGIPDTKVDRSLSYPRLFLSYRKPPGVQREGGVARSVPLLSPSPSKSKFQQASFTGPDERTLETGFKEPDKRASRMHMKHQVEKVLDSSGEGQVDPLHHLRSSFLCSLTVDHAGNGYHFEHGRGSDAGASAAIRQAAQR